VGLLYVNDNPREKLYFVYLKALSRGIILSVLLLLIAAFVFYYTDLNESFMSSIVWIITILGICYTCIFGSYRIGSKGLIHGIFLGIIYILLLGLIALLAEKGGINNTSFVIMLVMSMVIGAICGVIGTMLSKN
jgi:putative membrane protein (TIGR04086 family)